MIVSLDDLQTVYADLKSRQQEYIHATGSQPSNMLILLTPEVDSLCSARILVSLLKSDLVTFVIKPVQQYTEMIEITKQYLKDENVRTPRTHTTSTRVANDTDGSYAWN